MLSFCHFRPSLRNCSLWTALLGLVLAGAGCEKKEKVLEIKTPGFDLEVNKTGSGASNVEIKSDGKDKIEIDTQKHQKP